GRRIASRDDPAALAYDGCAIPPDDEPVLRFTEIADLVERFEIVRAALVAFFLVFVLAAAELERATVRPAPDVRLAVIARSCAQNVRGAIDQRADIPMNPPQAQRARV